MPDKENATPKNGEEKKPEPKDQIVETKHSITLGGQEIKYTVTTGTIVLKEEAEKKGDKQGESEGESPRHRSSSSPTRATMSPTRRNVR